MNSVALRVVLLVSCAHAMVHVYELALPSTEQSIAESFDVTEKTTGLLGNVWRLPFGLGALAAGWLADRFGSKPLLIVFLVGCAATSIVTWAATDLTVLFLAMFSMGSFASIYHPAGLAIISRATPPDQRPWALGIHGVFGSVGIAASPALIGVALDQGASWRECYLWLSVPGLLLAAVLYKWLVEKRSTPEPVSSNVKIYEAEDTLHWVPFLILVSSGALTGFVYAGVLQFLPRYLSDSWASLSPHGSTPREAVGAWLAGGVLLIGVIGQLMAGWYARGRSLERMLAVVLAANVPFLYWMSHSDGWASIVSAGLLSLVLFMHQPIYNSLVAKYIPHDRRSVGYGFSNVLTFGFGSFGAGSMGFLLERYGNSGAYLTLAIFAGTGTLLAIALDWQQRRKPFHK